MQTKEKTSTRRHQVPVGLDPMLRTKLERIAGEQQVSLAEVIRRALIAYEGSV